MSRPIWLLLAALAGCGAPPPPPEDTRPPPPPVLSEADTCQARADEIARGATLPGALLEPAARAAMYGRARGEPVLWIRAPRAKTDAELSPSALASRRTFERESPGIRVDRLIARHERDPRTLRALVLREGYVYTEEPLDAFVLASRLRLADLFDEPEIWIARGGATRRLERHAGREPTYRWTDGADAGTAADVLFGDRVAVARADLARPLHRDVAALADAVGFELARPVAIAEDALVLDLDFGDAGVTRAVATSADAGLSIACLAAGDAQRAAIAARREAIEPRLGALARVRRAVSDEVREGFRFDRPEGETGPDRDGQLRPAWFDAYLRGQSSFEAEDTTLPVFDPAGHPWPPQVCVDFVLDSFERASGTWFRPRGDKPGRERGGLDFDAGLRNRRAVLAFGDYAAEHADLFDFARVPERERIPFADRARFFGWLLAHPDAVHAGDVVAIKGMKRDNRIHQHAILVERTDPLSGFPTGLADQMKRPRRRTWEGIMAEAPQRSLLWRVRPREVVWKRIATEGAEPDDAG